MASPPIEIGFVFKDLELSDKLNKILVAIDKFHMGGANITLFLCDRKEAIFLPLPKFYITAAFDYHGILISNDSFTAEKIKHYPDHNKRIYCMWEDEPIENIQTITTIPKLSTKHNIPLIKELEYERVF